MTELHHRHLEPPRNRRDATMLNICDADESLYVALGIQDGHVLGVSTCSYVIPSEAVRLLTEAIRIIKEWPTSSPITEHVDVDKG